jgi:hypothetical protein
MRAKRKEICKERLWRVLEPQEWLQRFADWRKCQPGSPKRQAYEIIKRLAYEGKSVGSWTARVAASSPRGRTAARVKQTRDGQDQKPG